MGRRRNPLIITKVDGGINLAMPTSRAVPIALKRSSAVLVFVVSNRCVRTFACLNRLGFCKPARGSMGVDDTESRRRVYTCWTPFRRC